MYDVKEVTKGLNTLLEKNYDAHKGFENASLASDNIKLKQFFLNKANQRKIYADQLISEITRLGGTPVENGSAAGFMHRAWMDVKATFSDNNEEAVLEACETGEKASLEDYDDFLNKKTIGPETRLVVENQRNHIADTLGKVKRLENAFDA